MKNMYLSLFSLLFFTISIQAQQAKGKLEMQLDKTVYQPGDSVRITVNYTDSSIQKENLSLATLEMVVEHEQGQRTRLRWPVMNGQASGVLYLPDSLPRGKYTLLAGLQQRFFEVVGTIQNAGNIGSIQALLLTKESDWDEQQVTVAPDGTFAIRNWLFEDNALIAFSPTGNNKQPLNIRISTQLDSSFTPLAVAGRTFYLGNPPPEVQPTLNQPVATSEALFSDQGSVLPAVVVQTTVKSPAEQFDEKYATGLFRSGNERMMSILDDPSAMSFTNVFAYLQGRVAGLQIASVGLSGGVARWRGRPVTFFVDEIRTSAQHIATIPMSDIAIVKAFPPPFIGTSGSGGAIAIYTRRGGEAQFLPAGRQVFRVRGYTPSATVLNLDKLSM